jgi:hypothetical protein
MGQISLSYANDVNVLGENIDTIENTETLISASKWGWSRNKHREN